MNPPVSHRWQVAELGFEPHSLDTEFIFIATTWLCLIFKYNLQIYKHIWGSHAQVFVVFFFNWKCCSIKKKVFGTFLVVQWLTLHAPNAGGLGSIPVRSCAATKIWCSQINFFLKLFLNFGKNVDKFRWNIQLFPWELLGSRDSCQAH